jgi:hypothetical protein
MSLATFIKKETAPIGNQPIQQEPSSFTDVLSKQFRSFRDNFITTSRSNLINDQKSERAKLFEEIEGGKLDPARASNYKPFEEPSAQAVLELGPIHISNMRKKHDEKYIEDYIAELKQKEPEKYKNILTKEELEDQARKTAKLSKLEAQQASARSGTFSGVSANLLGGIGAVATDPINIAVLPFGAARGAGVLRTVLIEAGVNATAELATQPFVSKWQKELGEDYGFKEVVENVGFAALFGGSMAGALKGAKPSAMLIYNKMSKIKNLKPSQKIAASYMSKVAHLKEAMPFVRSKTLVETKKHYDSVKAASEALENGKKVKPDDIKVTESEFLALDTKPKRGDTQIEKARLAELERFKKDKDPLVLEASKFDNVDDFIESVPIKKGSLDGAMGHRPTKTGANASNITQEVSEMGFPDDFYKNPQYYEDMSDKSVKESFNALTNVKGSPDAEITIYRASPKKELRTGDWVTLSKEYAKGESLAEGVKVHSFKVKAKEIEFAGDSINEFGYWGHNSKTKEQLTEAFNKAKKEPTQNQPRVNPESSNKDVLEPDFMDRLLDESNNPQFIQAEDINFRALAEENPDLLISLEDGEFRIGELLERFDNDENFLKQITTCTIG